MTHLRIADVRRDLPLLEIALGDDVAVHLHEHLLDDLRRRGLRGRRRLRGLTPGGSAAGRALGRLGVDARVGEVPGEYCPGRWSVNAGGERKLAGIGQRIVAGGAHVGTVLVAEDGASVGRVLEPVYRALELEWDPATVGAAIEESTGATWDAVRDALLAEYAERFELVEDQLDDETLALARELAPEHRPPEPAGV